MSLYIETYARPAEILQREDRAKPDILWVENVVAITATAFMVLCASSLTIFMYLD